MKYKISAFAMAIVLLASFMPTLVHAQDASSGTQSGNGFRISPVRVEMTIDKGKSDTATLSIENPTSGPINAKIVANDFEAAADETGQPRIILDSTKSAPSNSFKSLIGDLGSIYLPPSTTKDIKVKITVPANASAGGYYGAVRVVPDTEANKNVSLSASVGTIFLITVPGQLTESLQLVEFTAAKNGSTGRFFVNSGEMSIVTRLKNTGNIHVKPFGHVQVTDRSGKVVEEYEFNNGTPRANVLPNTTRKFDDKLKNQKWIGKYTITANLGYGTSGSLITAKNTFWVIPVWVFIALAVLVVLFVLAGFFVYRKFTTKSKHTTRPRH
jgi:hypothetical protein